MSRKRNPDSSTISVLDKSEMIEEDEYFEERETAGKPKRGIVSSSPEVTGQIGSMISVDDLSSIEFETNRID